jgi:hypothetical protein
MQSFRKTIYRFLFPASDSQNLAFLLFIFLLLIAAQAGLLEHYIFSGRLLRDAASNGSVPSLPILDKISSWINIFIMVLITGAVIIGFLCLEISILLGKINMEAPSFLTANAAEKIKVRHFAGFSSITYGALSITAGLLGEGTILTFYLGLLSIIGLLVVNAYGISNNLNEEAITEPDVMPVHESLLGVVIIMRISLISLQSLQSSQATPH